MFRLEQTVAFRHHRPITTGLHQNRSDHVIPACGRDCSDVVASRIGGDIGGGEQLITFDEELALELSESQGPQGTGGARHTLTPGLPEREFGASAEIVHTQNPSGNKISGLAGIDCKIRGLRAGAAASYQGLGPLTAYFSGCARS
jgi:hypothetical protein